MRIDRRRLFALGASAVVASAIPAAALSAPAVAAPVVGAMTMGEYVERIAGPAMKRLAEEFDRDMCRAYREALAA